MITAEDFAKSEEPWKAMAKRIVAGWKPTGTPSHLESIWIGLHRINDPDCQQATKIMEELMKKKGSRK